MNFKDKNTHTPIEDTIECVEALAKILKDNDLGRIKVSTDELDIIIEGKKAAAPVNMPAVAAAVAAAPAVSAETEIVCEKVSGNIVTSPIIGTFYAAPSPEKPPFVKVGDTVNAGDVVCIIESMKLMNEINCEFSGRVAEIYVNNGDAVEYGQKLMRIE